MTNISNLFEEAENAEVTVGTRGLAGTAQLTALATDLTNEALKKLNENLEQFNDQWKQSKVDHSAMDKLLDELLDLDNRDLTEETQFLTELPDDIIEGMLKSQQSKRSRAKSKLMTLENYKAMMIGALAENIIRRTCNKPKGAVGNRGASMVGAYSEERLAELANDMDGLRREIRNIQSKKSILKSKAGFSEDDERWQALLVSEAQLKDIRGNSSSSSLRSDLVALFDGVDIQSLRSAEAKELLEKIHSAL